MAIIERKVLTDEITLVANQIANIMPPDTKIPIPNSQWTVGDACAHLVISQRLSKKFLHGEKNPYKDAKPKTMALTNAELLKAFPERNGEVLAKLLIKETDAFLKETNRIKDSDVFKIHFGTIDFLTSLSYNLCHLLIHGSAIAIALKKPLPLEEKHIPLVLRFMKYAMLHTYNKKAAGNLQATFGIHIRNVAKYAIICDREEIKIVDTIPSKVTCHISAGPIVFFLVSIGLMSPWPPILTGKVSLWGTKPWLALRLLNLFERP